jgi:hypothetical protein
MNRKGATITLKIVAVRFLHATLPESDPATLGNNVDDKNAATRD